MGLRSRQSQYNNNNNMTLSTSHVLAIGRYSTQDGMLADATCCPVSWPTVF